MAQTSLQRQRPVNNLTQTFKAVKKFYREELKATIFFSICKEDNGCCSEEDGEAIN